jgi:hypothetical protein
MNVWQLSTFDNRSTKSWPVLKLRDQFSSDLLAIIVSIQFDNTAATTILARMTLRSQRSSTLGLITAKMTTISVVGWSCECRHYWTEKYCHRYNWEVGFAVLLLSVIHKQKPSGFNIKEKREEVIDGSVPLCIMKSRWSLNRRQLLVYWFSHLQWRPHMSTCSQCTFIPKTVQPNEMEKV